MTNKDALAILNELHKLPDVKLDRWTAGFLESIDFEVRVGKRNLSPRQGSKLLEVYARITESFCAKPPVNNLQV